MVAGGNSAAAQMLSYAMGLLISYIMGFLFTYISLKDEEVAAA